MVYNGDLTFCPGDPQRYLKIPNADAVARIAHQVLEMYGLRHSVSSAHYSLRRGDIRPMLSCYRDFLVQQDDDDCDDAASKQTHRERFNSILRGFFAYKSAKYAKFQLPRVRQYSI